MKKWSHIIYEDKRVSQTQENWQLKVDSGQTYCLACAFLLENGGFLHWHKALNYPNITRTSSLCEVNNNSVHCQETWDSLHDSVRLWTAARWSWRQQPLHAADWQLSGWELSVGAAVGGVKRERCRAIESNSGNVLSFQFHFQRVVIGTAQGQRPCYADALKLEGGRGRVERRKVKKHRDLWINEESKMS